MSMTETPRLLARSRSIVRSICGLLNFRLTSGVWKTGLLFTSSRNRGSDPRIFSKLWFCSTNCTGRPLRAPPPLAEIVCSWLTNTRASVIRPVRATRKSATSCCERRRSPASERRSSTAPVFTEEPPPVTLRHTRFSGTESPTNADSRSMNASVYS